MNKFQVVFIIFIIAFVSIIIGLSILADKILDELNKICHDKGLKDKCTAKDECQKDCTDLNKDFYRFENGGFGESDNCWCKIKEDTVQIW